MRIHSFVSTDRRQPRGLSLSLTTLILLDGDNCARQTHNNHRITPHRATFVHGNVLKLATPHHRTGFEVGSCYCNFQQRPKARFLDWIANLHLVLMSIYSSIVPHRTRASAWLLAWGHCWAAAEISSTRSPGELAGWVVSDWRRWP